MSTIKKELQNKSSYQIAHDLYNIACDTKGQDIIVLDVHKMSVFADYFIIMSGRSTRHVQGLASAIDKGINSKRLKDTNTEGLQEGHWVLLDLGDIIVHIFYKEHREYYDLEGLWHDAPRIDFKA